MIVIVMVAMAATVFLFIAGYNFEYMKLAFGHYCFMVDKYKFCPSDKFKVILIQNKNEKFSYINGFNPIFSKDSSESFVMLKEINKNDLIIVSLGKHRSPSIKDGCSKGLECLYRDIILFGKPAYSVIVLKFPNFEFFEVPSLKIEISSGLIDDDTLNEINIMKIGENFQAE